MLIHIGGSDHLIEVVNLYKKKYYLMLATIQNFGVGKVKKIIFLFLKDVSPRLHLSDKNTVKTDMFRNITTI